MHSSRWARRESKLRSKAKAAALPVTSSNEARHVNPDLHGRETFSRTGGLSSGQDFRVAAHFDGANNRDAFGPPANGAPDYCRVSGNDSPVCWWFRYDRANRLNRANAPNGLSRSCFDYDAVGNIIGVTTGDADGGAPLSCDSSYNTPGTLTSGVASSTSVQYTWDDFGNIIQVKNTGVDDAASNGTRYLYDAQGNVIEKQTAAMASGVKQRFTWDGLGRLRQADSFQTSDAGVTVLYQLEYETPSVAPPGGMGLLTNRAGRLSRRYDSYGDTWYAYDEAGRTKAEYRKRLNCSTAQRGVLCEPHTFYTWDKNGNLTRLTYPFGRRVDYSYGTGQLRDRVAQVSIDVFSADGGAGQRTFLDGVAWEPYGGLRAYHMRLNGNSARGVEYFLGATPETFQEAVCNAGVAGPPDGSGRVKGMFVSTKKLELSASSHVPGDVFAQQYTWAEDQLSRQRTCLANASSYDQAFSYDALQRLTAETSYGTPHYLYDGSLGTTRVFDSRGNRIDGSRDEAGHAVRGARAGEPGGARALRCHRCGGGDRTQAPSRPRQPVRERCLPGAAGLPRHRVQPVLRARARGQRLHRATHPHAEGAAAVAAALQERRRAAAGAPRMARAVQHAVAD